MESERYAVVRFGQHKYQFSKFHECFDEAKREAMRLSEIERDRFIVLKVVGFAELQAQPIVWVDLKDEVFD
jgi:hypothetical protein